MPRTTVPGGYLLLGVGPGVLHHLLEAQRDALGLGVELEHLDPDVVADLEQLRGVGDPAPGHVGDVQQAVDAAQVDEGAVLGEVLDDALDDLAFLELVERLLLELGALLLEQHPAGQHDVAALLVELDDLEAVGFADVGVEVAHRPQVDLRARQERLHPAADGDREAALDPRADGPFDELVALTGGGDLVPDLETVGLLLGQDTQAVLVLAALEEDVDLVADLDADLALAVHELVQRNRAFGLVADVDDDVFVAQRDDLAFDDVAFFEVFSFERLLEESGEALLALGRCIAHGHRHRIHEDPLARANRRHRMPRAIATGLATGRSRRWGLEFVASDHRKHERREKLTLRTARVNVNPCGAPSTTSPTGAQEGLHRHARQSRLPHAPHMALYPPRLRTTASIEIDHLLGRQAGGVDLEGVVGLAQGGDGPGAVPVIPQLHLAQDLGGVHLPAGGAQLPGPPFGPHRHRGGQEELRRGGGKHDRPGVAALGHDPPPGADRRCSCSRAARTSGKAETREAPSEMSGARMSRVTSLLVDDDPRVRAAALEAQVQDRRQRGQARPRRTSRSPADARRARRPGRARPCPGS